MKFSWKPHSRLPPWNQFNRSRGKKASHNSVRPRRRRATHTMAAASAAQKEKIRQGAGAKVATRPCPKHQIDDAGHHHAVFVVLTPQPGKRERLATGKNRKPGPLIAQRHRETVGGDEPQAGQGHRQPDRPDRRCPGVAKNRPAHRSEANARHFPPLKRASSGIESVTARGSKNDWPNHLTVRRLASAEPRPLYSLPQPRKTRQGALFYAAIS